MAIKYIVGNEAAELSFSYIRDADRILAGYITGKVLEGGSGKTGPTIRREIGSTCSSPTIFHALIGLACSADN